MSSRSTTRVASPEAKPHEVANLLKLHSLYRRKNFMFLDAIQTSWCVYRLPKRRNPGVALFVMPLDATLAVWIAVVEELNRERLI